MGASFDKDPWHAVAALAARQHGRVTTKQLEACGVGRGSVDHARRRGRLHREHVGVYAVGHAASSAEARWMAAVLAGGKGAVLSHRSAATLWEVRRGEGPDPDVTVPTTGGRDRPGVRFHRSPLLPEELTERRGIPVVTVARVLVELAHVPVVSDDELTRAVREAQYRRLFDLEATRAAAARWSSRALDGILEAFDVVSTSWLEDRFVDLLKRYRIPPPTGQHRIGGHRVDFAWEAHRVVVELDGAAAHLTVDALQRDRAQGNALQLAGWVVLRFTHADLRHRPREVARVVRAALGE